MVERLPPWNLYQRVLDDAQRRRQEGDDRQAGQIRRIELKGNRNGIVTAQEQRSEQQTIEEDGTRRIRFL